MMREALMVKEGRFDRIVDGLMNEICLPVDNIQLMIENIMVNGIQNKGYLKKMDDAF